MTSIAFPNDERINNLLHEAEKAVSSAIKLKLQNTSDTLGRYEHRERTVYLYHNMPEDAKLFTIAHELAHVIWRGRGYPRVDFVEWLAQQKLSHSQSFHRFALLIRHINNLVQDMFADDVANSEGFLTEDVYNSICLPLLKVDHFPDWQFDGVRFQNGVKKLCQAIKEEDISIIPEDLRLDLQLIWYAPKYATIQLRCACHSTFIDYKKAFNDSLPSVCELGEQLATIAQTYPLKEPRKSRVTLIEIINHLYIPKEMIVVLVDDVQVWP